MYTLILPEGKTIVFNLLSCAELYKTAYGGTLFSSIILEQKNRELSSTLDIPTDCDILYP